MSHNPHPICASVTALVQATESLRADLQALIAEPAFKDYTVYELIAAELEKAYRSLINVEMGLGGTRSVEDQLAFNANEARLAEAHKSNPDQWERDPV